MLLGSESTTNLEYLLAIGFKVEEAVKIYASKSKRSRSSYSFTDGCYYYYYCF